MSEEKEVFKPLEEFENMYEVSNHGRVGSWRRRGGGLSDELNILTPSMNGGKDYKYLKVGLTLPDGRKRPTKVKDLVAKKFLPDKPSDKHILVHRDLDKSNCRADNLVWMTKDEYHEFTQAKRNTVKGVFGTYGEDHNNASITDQAVEQIRAKYLNKDHGKTLEEIAKEFNTTKSKISSILSNRVWQHTNNKYARRTKITSLHRRLFDFIVSEEMLKEFDICGRDARIFTNYMKEEIPLTALGSRYDLSRERVRNIIEECISKIKKFLTAKAEQ